MTQRGIVIMDIGKSNAKLSLLNADSGAVLHSESVHCRSKPVPCYPHIDTDHIWAWYLKALATASQHADITHINVTAHGAAGALIADAGLVLPVMDYEFDGPDELAQQYNALCDPFDVTYSPRLPHGLNLGRQLFWQRERFPAEFHRASHFLPYAQYWTWRLTGNVAAEVSSIGSHTDLWDANHRTYSPFARSQGFDRLFPPMRYAGEVLGPLRKELAETTGIGTDCQVLVGLHDSNASLLPHMSVRSDPFTVMSTGTWVIIFAVGSSLHDLDPLRDCTANVNIHGEPVACARFMGGREFVAVAGEPLVVADREELLRMLDSDRHVMPAFSGEGGPFPGLQGFVEGLDNLSPKERYAIASLYCALLSDVSLGFCGSSGDIVVEGAYARNALLLQCLAAFRPGQRILYSSDETGTTLGAAMLVNQNIHSPVLHDVEKPDAALDDRMQDYRRRWRRAVAEYQQKPLTGGGRHAGAKA